MHGWRRGVKRADASLQMFWVFAEAGVRKVIADGGVGSLNHLLDPRDVVIPKRLHRSDHQTGHLRQRRSPPDHA